MMDARKLTAEFIGTFFLLATVVGSGIMAEDLSGGNTGLALLCNAIATGATLYVIITGLGPISGAHFNPAVTLAFALRKEISWGLSAAYVIVQIIGGILGVWVAHLMFDQPILQVSETMRSGFHLFAAEIVATFGLVFTIFAVVKANPAAVPAAVGLYITSAYWFTASTSFANPAVTIARGFSDTFAGIQPASILPFILAQLIGAVFCFAIWRWLDQRD